MYIHYEFEIRRYKYELSSCFFLFLVVAVFWLFEAS